MININSAATTNPFKPHIAAAVSSRRLIAQNSRGMIVMKRMGIIQRVLAKGSVLYL